MTRGIIKAGAALFLGGICVAHIPLAFSPVDDYAINPEIKKQIIQQGPVSTTREGDESSECFCATLKNTHLQLQLVQLAEFPEPRRDDNTPRYARSAAILVSGGSQRGQRLDDGNEGDAKP